MGPRGKYLGFFRSKFWEPPGVKIDIEIRLLAYFRDPEVIILSSTGKKQGGSIFL